MSMRRCLIAAALGAVAAPAAGQSFNIDFGQPGAGPPATYAAAGLPGVWMSIPGTQGVNYFNLTDVDGNATAARLVQIGGTQTLLTADPDLSGNDAVLMNDYLITHTLTENCLFFYDMEPGPYEVLIYARMPAQPGVLCVTTVDEEPGKPHYLVGGPWPGQHELGVSYALHLAEVAAAGPDAGKLRAHSGVPPGGDLGIGAALNGIQVRKIESPPGDLDGDGIVGVTDLLQLLGAWGECVACPEDLDGDDRVGVTDLLFLLAHWG